MKKLILILGMHRSGTSLLSRSMATFGADHGENLLPCTPGNKKGHWEDRDIYALNEAILKHLSQTWYSVDFLTQEDLTNLHKAGYFQKAKDLLQSKIDNFDIYALKEPRITKLFPFWYQVFKDLDISVKFVFAFRHPYSVAKSLEKRDKFSLDYSMFLWYSHNIFALKELEGEEVFFVNYDSFLESAEKYLKHLETFLEEPINDSEKNIFLDEFIDTSLRSYETTDIVNISEKYEHLFNHLNSYNTSVKISVIDYENHIAYFDKMAYKTMQAQNKNFIEEKKIFLSKEKDFESERETLKQQVVMTAKALKEQSVKFEAKLQQTKEDFQKQIRQQNKTISEQISLIENYKKKDAQDKFNIADIPVSLLQTFKNIIFQPVIKKNAFAHCNIGNLEYAEYIAKQIITNNPTIAWAHYILGKVQWQRGNNKQAIINTQRAIDLEPNTEYFKIFHNSMIQVKAQATTTSKNKKKVIIFGNCQSNAIGKTLLESSEFTQKYEWIFTPPVQTIKTQNQISTLLKSVSSSDVFIYQNVNSQSYPKEVNTSYLINLLPTNCKKISFPSIYFDGYFPHLATMKEIIGPLNQVHDYIIASAYNNGFSIDETKKMILSEELYNHSRAIKLLNNSILKLQTREKDLDIIVSDYIIENYKTDKLFNIFNHPKRKTLNHLCFKILEKLSIYNTNFAPRKAGYLDGVSTPIYPSTMKSLALSFKDQKNYVSGKNSLTLAETISKFYVLYDKIDKDDLKKIILEKKPFTLKIVEEYKTKNLPHLL